MLRKEGYDSIKTISELYTDADATVGLEKVLKAAKKDLKKANTIGYYKLVLNDYTVVAQKFLYKLGLPVDWLKQEIAQDAHVMTALHKSIDGFVHTYTEHAMRECLVCQSVNADDATSCTKCHSVFPKSKLVTS